MLNDITPREARLLRHLCRLAGIIVQARRDQARGAVDMLGVHIDMGDLMLQEELPALRRLLDHVYAGEPLPDGLADIANAEALFGPAARL